MQDGNLWLGVSRKWWTLAIVGAGTFMSALDTSIVNIALPTISRAAHSPVSTVEWVILIYLITVSASLLVFGRLADIYGKKRIYMAGMFVFTLGSLFCALSGRVELLIASRAVQAMGAAMLFALSPAIIIGVFPASERGRALGLQATMTYLGMTVGPALGGFLTQRFGWASIFFINVPIGFAMVCFSYRVLVEERSDSSQAFDPAGAGAMAVALSSLLFALSKGSDMGWNSPLILSMLALALLAGTAFVVIEGRVEHPALDFRLFANRRFSASTLAAFCCYAATGAVGFLMPFYLIHANGFPEAKAGLIVMSTSIAMMIFTGPSGYLSDKVGVRLPATLGAAVTTAAMLLLRRLHPGALPLEIVPYTALVGVGAGLFNSPNNSAIMGSAPVEMRGVAGAILAAARTVGFAAGVALAGLIYMSQLKALRGLSEPVAVTSAVHSGVTLVACLAFAGVCFSAFRGKKEVREGA